MTPTPTPTPSVPHFTPPDCASASGARRRSTGSTSRSSPAPCTACSARTAPARRPQCAASPPSPTIDDGTATIDGIDIRTQPAAVRERIGLVGQFHAVDEALTARQNLVLFARLSGISKSPGAGRAADLFEAFELTDAADRAVAGFSGGMRRRLDIAASLVLTPAILFLDEPTTGLDPRGRATVWQAVREIAAAGTTVLLTTQYLDEADQLADRVSVMEHGRVIAEGSPTTSSADSAATGSTRSSPTAPASRRPSDHRATGAAASADADTRTVTVEVADGAACARADRARARRGDTHRRRSRPASAHPRRGVPAPHRRRRSNQLRRHDDHRPTPPSPRRPACATVVPTRCARACSSRGAMRCTRCASPGASCSASRSTSCSS